MPGILVIDDSEPVREMLAVALERLGYEPHCVGRGEEALALVGALQPDVILLDLNLPGMNGRLVLKALKNITQVPVVAMTADADIIEDEGWKEAGFDDLLAKPVSVTPLARLLYQYVLPPEK